MMKSLIVYICFICGILDITAAATSYGECVTPKNERSMCIELTQCPPLLGLVQKVDLTIAERTLLSRSQCGYRNQKVLVCCPPVISDLLPRPPQCGTALANRIYGGNLTKIDEYPWMALLEYTKPGNKKGFHCGGALINNRYVITAAHCIHSVPSEWRLTGVRLGEWDLTTSPDCEIDAQGKSDCAPQHVDVGVEEKISHPQYVRGSRNQENDIALLRLSRVVALTDFIKPVCLPINTNLRRSTYSDYEMDVAGWGRTETSDTSSIKLKASIPGWEFERCKNKYKEQRVTLQTTQMCAGGVSGIDSCRGDSGGPLVLEERVNNRAVNMLVGIVSFGPSPCGLSGWPGVYTRVADYIDWIQNTIR